MLKNIRYVLNSSEFKVHFFSTEFFSLLWCCTIKLLTRNKGWMGAQKHSVCPCAGTCNSVVVVCPCLSHLFFVHYFVHTLVCYFFRLNYFTFIISFFFIADYVVWFLLMVEGRTVMFNVILISDRELSYWKSYHIFLLCIKPSFCMFFYTEAGICFFMLLWHTFLFSLILNT